MTLPPKFLLILSLFQISLGLGWDSGVCASSSYHFLL